MKTAIPKINGIKFEFGQLCFTAGAREKLTDNERLKALIRHAVGDWGYLTDDDWHDNEDAIVWGGRLLSSYRSDLGERFWIITEADRSVTTVLLPEEY